MNEKTKQALRKEGLKLGDSVAKKAVEATFNIIEIIVKDTENKIDDLIIPALPKLKELALEYADNIYVEENGAA